MDRRVVVALFVTVLVAALFVPASVVAADAPKESATTAPGAGADALALDRLRPTVGSSGPARAGDRPRGQADRDGLLEQSTRAAIYEAVRESPGETLGAVADAVGVTKSTVRYHARLLTDAGLLESVEVAGALRLAPADADAELLASMHADGTGAVLNAVAEHEPASVTALAAATDRAPSTVSHHLSTLEKRGLVERERAGESVATTLAPSAREALAADPPAPADD